MYEAQKTPIFYILFDISINIQAIKNLNIVFGKGSIDEKRRVKVEKRPLVAELKLKMLKSFYLHF